MKKSGSSWPLVGAIAAGIAASLCCIGPLLALSLGLGSFAASTFFAQWRPVLLTLTFVLLGAAWYFAYRRPAATCDDGSCARRPGRPMRLALWLGTIIAVASAAYPWVAGIGGGASDAAAVPIASGERFSVSVPTMDCAACATGIEASLRSVPGVRAARVDYGSKRADVVFDPAITSAAQLLASIDRTGFPADRSTIRP
ncbi:MAG: heavy-metal-associated domain-containing protein [Opitutaceae bacterium]